MTSIDIYSENSATIFIQKAKIIHEEKYKYEFVNYIHSKQKVKIECAFHGIFHQTPNSHLSGHGCPVCSIDSSNKTRTSNTTTFIQKAKNIHGELYDYSLVEYKNAMTNVQIECKIHGIFEQKPNTHLNGKGCLLCSIDAKKSNTNIFIQKANNVHGEIYTYTEVNYINSRSKIKIECKIHGIFEQIPSNHLKGSGCPKCTNRISKISDKWLETLNIQDLIVEYRLPENLYKAVDGYSPSTNTVYQFHGDYWHGNPLKYNSEETHPTRKITYGNLYKTTIQSDKFIISLGYNLVTIWESDFNN